MAMLIVILGAIADAASIPIFQDDFDAYPVGSDPTTPPVGQPWQITEITPENIAVDENGRLMFGSHRNRALAPFSPDGRQLIRQNGNFSATFDYIGYHGMSDVSQYFDVAGYDPVSGDPAFFLRFSPQQNEIGQGRFHDVLYLDPSGSLLDTNVDIDLPADTAKSVSIVADFNAETYDFEVGDSSATLPMFIAADEIVGLDFANYSVAAGSGSVDNLDVSVTSDKQVPIPEVATVWMVIAGLLALAGFWAARRGDQ